MISSLIEMQIDYWAIIPKQYVLKEKFQDDHPGTFIFQ